MFEGPGPLLVLAGPGSGKTLVITQRVRYLTEHKKVSPDKILVVTYTKEAAVSMKNRYLQESISVKQENVSRTVKQENVSQTVNFGTIHSIFYHILKKSSNLQEKQLLSDAEKRKIFQGILGKVLPNLSFLEKNNLWLDLMPAISYYKNTGGKKEALMRLPMEVRDKFEEIYIEYEKERRILGKLDFDDMLSDCRALLEKNDTIRNYWQERFDHILVDEFQDVNPIQYEVIKLLAGDGRSIFAVGDDDQSIYGFRGADPSCMKRFVEELGAKTIVLNLNYRCTPEIVNISLKLIDHNKNRFQKKINSYQETSGLLKKKCFDTKEKQMEYLKDICITAAKEGQEGSVAILFRTNRIMQRVALSLKKAGIPYEMKEKERDPYRNETALDLIAYLKLAAGLEEAESLCRIINKPSRFVSREALANSKRTLKGLMDYYERKGTDAWERCMLLQKHLNVIKKLSPLPAMFYVRKVIGYEKWINEGLGGCETQREEAREIMDFLAEEARGQVDLREWLQKLGEEGTKEAKPKTGTRGKLNLMTVHAAKGLEFDRVIIPFVNERIFPHGALADEKVIEEERRIFYVAMTRTKRELELLYVSGATSGDAAPSRFLDEI